MHEGSAPFPLGFYPYCGLQESANFLILLHHPLHLHGIHHSDRLSLLIPKYQCWIWYIQKLYQIWKRSKIKVKVLDILMSNSEKIMKIHGIFNTSQTLTVSSRVVLSFRMTTASFPLESKNPLKTVGASGSSTLAIILSSESLKNTSKHKSYLFCGQSNLLNDGREPALAKKIILFENIGKTWICDISKFLWMEKYTFSYPVRWPNPMQHPQCRDKWFRIWFL